MSKFQYNAIAELHNAVMDHPSCIFACSANGKLIQWDAIFSSHVGFEYVNALCNFLHHVEKVYAVYMTRTIWAASLSRNKYPAVQKNYCVMS